MKTWEPSSGRGSEKTANSGNGWPNRMSMTRPRKEDRTFLKCQKLSLPSTLYEVGSPPGSALTAGRYKVITTRARRIQPPPPPRPGPPSGRVPSWTLAWCRRTPQSDSELHRQHLEYLLAKDWSATPMGPLDEWPQSLRTMSSYVLNCPFPCAMFWGEEIAIL